jgi:hypothetical protein
VSPLNHAILPRPYAVVANQYANFASIIETGNDAVIGQFETGFYGEDLVFNANGTRLYLTDRFLNQVRAFRINPGPTVTQLAAIPTGETDLDRANPRDLAISADGTTLYALTRALSRLGYLPVGVTDKTPDPTNGGNGTRLFATHEEIGLRWLTQSYSEDGQKSCGHCHWQSRHDGGRWNVGGNAIGGPKISPQNKDTSDNWQSGVALLANFAKAAVLT